jgi:predicted permease
MGLQLVSWIVALAGGLALQRRPDAIRLNRRVWNLYFWTVAPAAIAYAYTTIHVDRNLVGSLAVVAASSWLLLGIALVVSRVALRDRAERGAFVLGSGWGNTVALGYPIAQLAFGTPGLALQVLYAQFYFGVPGIAISTTVARLHGVGDGSPAGSFRTALGVALRNPPLLFAAGAVAARVANVDLVGLVTPLGHAAGVISGPLGFLQLGLAVPLSRFAHGRRDVAIGAGVLVMRHAVAPLLVVALGAAAGLAIPPVFVLAAAAPVAFHIVTLARVFAIRAELVRLLTVGSTVLGGIGIVVWAATMAT